MRTAIDGQVTNDQEIAVGHPLVTGYRAGDMLAGKYRLEVLLGEGGMGAVWRASNVLLDLPVAIKLIRADLDRGAFRARLQLEARAAAKLGHSSIVRVFDVGESEHGDPFIVMEHLRGETLAQLISRGPVPATRAAQLLLPIIDALAAAHSRGIVHRDLKPDNVMLALEEQRVCPKILDFGIAKLTDPRDANLKLTEVGAVVGSPEYMSPEQARGRDDIDASTDIWSTCVVLYEAITGRTPFTASNLNALLRSIVEDAPSPISEYALDDAALWQILERGLRKDRAQRYAKISELGQALATWLVSHGVTEDACGSALDSKWFGRKGDPLGLGQAPLHPASIAPASNESAAAVRESIPDSTGIARGPFTKTVLPNSHTRTRTLSAGLAACALLASSWFAFGPADHEAAPRAAAFVASAPAQDEAATMVPQLDAPPAAVAPVERAFEATSSDPEVRPQTSARPEPRPKAPAARTIGFVTPPTRAVPAITVPVTAPPPSPAPAAKSERPLDLLTPY
ncbi:MAG TPA: serine/threonine-protein kinase [Polyangiaceae bacterium]|nr:serine/threonine-protein kinase [Polyangiaceae bacterium]